MSQPPASSSMTQKVQTTPPTDSYNSKVIFEAALEAYKKKTKQSLKDHALVTQFETCGSPAAILDLLRGQVNPNADERLKKWLNPTINVLYAFSATLGEGFGLMFPPAKVIFAGVGVLLLAAKDLNEDQGTLIDILEQIERFFRRLEIYTEVPPTLAMKDTMVKIMVEILDILAIATKEIKQNRAKKFLKKLAGRTDMKDALMRLDRLTKEEAGMARAQTLRNTEVIKAELTVVSNNMDDVKRSQLRESLRNWQSPPDPSINHNIAYDRQHEDTAEWFLRGGIFKKWKATGSLLWIHGKPGSGKSVLCSAIIEDILMHKAGLASVAYFYFDFRDIDKQSRRKLLSSLLVQLSAHSDLRCDILSRLYEAHGNGASQPKDRALTQCLKEMLTLPDQGPVYLVLDALDECPNTSEFPSTRKRVLDLVKDLVCLQLPNLHICVTSRPEVDIRDDIEPLAFHSVSLHVQNGQKEDIASYVRSVVYSNSGAAMRRWREEEKELAIKTLSDQADGMFRWVYCQLEVLQNCLPNHVRQKLRELPKTLDETYERILEEIGKVDGDLAHRIFQCLAVARRPLRVVELAEILALDFEEAEGRIPKFKENWRLQDRQQALLITCSSLITIVDDHGSRVVQFSHFSVKEFLMSDRLATSIREISSFHILPEPAHTILAQACLAVLLHLDNYIPLARYAAQHWVDHAQFKKVSSRVEDGMQRLFDPSKPYFLAWLKLHDIDFRNLFQMPQPSTPLYYASLCGFRDLAESLTVKSPQDVNASGGRHHSPLAAALHNRHFHIAELLRQHGAVIELASDNNRTVLFNGHADAVQWLLERGANVNLQQNDGRSSSPGVGMQWKHSGIVRDSPLHLALAHGHFKTVQLLIQHGADVTARDRSNATPLHLASRWMKAESVQLLLIQQKADVNARDEEGSTPLHLALRGGKAECVQLLIQHQADVNARDNENSTPLHLASRWGRAKSVQLLSQQKADVNARDEEGSTPLHLASRWGGAECVQLLIQHQADVNARDKENSTPLHLVSQVPNPALDTMLGTRVEAAEILIRHGADVNARNESNSTPLHLVFKVVQDVHRRHSVGDPGVEVVKVLIRHGADVNAQNESNSTPLHLAMSLGGAEIIQLLIQHGADVNARNESNSTPLHLVFKDVYALDFVHSPRVEVVKVLIRHGADVNARNESNSTPLHLASSLGGAEIIQLLIQHGADVNARDKRKSTPLHLALRVDDDDSVGTMWGARVKAVEVLIRHGADVHAWDEDNSTPLHQASLSNRAESMQLLIQHGVDVTARDMNHSTPLHLVFGSSAQYRDKSESVRLLIQSGADVNAQDKSNSTPLHRLLSSWRPESESVRLLLEHGANADATDDMGRTPDETARPRGLAHPEVEVITQLILDHRNRVRENSSWPKERRT